jgi:Sulfotransferase family
MFLIKKSKFCFLHIEKVAGTTLHEIFRNNENSYYITSPYNCKNLNKNQEIYLKSNELKNIKRFIPNFKGFGGHDLRLYEDYSNVLGSKIYGIVFLREPMERYISHFYYQKKIMGIDWDFKNFLKNKYFNNFMCKKISQKGEFNSAVKILDKKDNFIGIIEEFNQSIILMRNFFSDNNIVYNLDIRNNQRNVNKENDNYAKIKLKYYDDIYKVNEEDIKLYDFFKAMHYKRIKQINNLDELLNAHLLSCQNFDFNENKIKALKFFRRFYIKNIERIFRDTNQCPLG